jgi:hypothetical protein
MIRILLDVLVKFGLIMEDIFFIVLFLLDEMTAFGFDLIDEVFLFFDCLFVGFL